MKQLLYIGIIASLAVVGVSADVALAQESADPSAGGGLVVDCDGPDCGFNDLIQLAQNLINWMIFIAVPLSGVIFVVAGVMYATAAGNPARIAKAHSIFKNVAVGLVLVLGAWLIVYTITNSLLEENSGVQLLES